MTSSYSIAEAKNRLPELVREVENKGAVEITRRGIPVVVVLPIHEYEQTKKNKFDFWEAYLAFRRRLDEEGIDLNPDEIFADVRDRSAPVEPRW